jgi:hypothetical protein
MMIMSAGWARSKMLEACLLRKIPEAIGGVQLTTKVCLFPHSAFVRCFQLAIYIEQNDVNLPIRAVQKAVKFDVDQTPNFEMLEDHKR